MTKSNPNYFRVIAIGIALIVVVLVVGFTFRPSMPSEWRNLRVGMTREMVAANVTDAAFTDMYEIKGFDTYKRKTALPGATSYLQLIVSFNSEGLVRHASAQFLNPHCGLFSTAPEQIVSEPNPPAL